VKNIATGILVLFLIMYVVLVLCLKQQVLISDNWYFLKAFLEAGLIGALADWFAVVAIFKHPLNLPIPHTNIIIKNKEFLSLLLFFDSQMYILMAFSLRNDSKR